MRSSLEYLVFEANANQVQEILVHLLLGVQNLPQAVIPLLYLLSSIGGSRTIFQTLHSK